MDGELKVSNLFFHQRYGKRAFQVTGGLTPEAIQALEKEVYRAKHAGDGLFLVKNHADSYLAQSDAMRVCARLNHTTEVK